jgi:hypothetical protein
MSYHKTEIPKGKLGEFSKIEEEFLELKDGYEQDHKILQICELADLVGAIEEYGKKFNLTLDDIIKMKQSTKEAFENGDRT